MPAPKLFISPLFLKRTNKRISGRVVEKYTIYGISFSGKLHVKRDGEKIYIRSDKTMFVLTPTERISLPPGTYEISK